MKKIFLTIVVALSAMAAFAQSDIKKNIKIGPEGDSALYYWNPAGSGGNGHWQLASDYSGLLFEKNIGVKPEKGIISLYIQGIRFEFYFDGYWRLHSAKPESI
jgi:opacity protein-like surface antigen